MIPRYISLAQVFGPPIRFVVPLFQRPYVWKQAEQWQPLWEDVCTVAERVLAAGPGGPVRGHFLGSVVLEQKSTGTGSVERRSVIDGQQRLTTIQLLLKAAFHAFSTMSIEIKRAEDQELFAKAAQQMTSLIINPSYAEGEELYKVWPTNEDRLAFCGVIDAVDPSTIVNADLMSEGHKFFFKEIVLWLKKDERSASRAITLGRVLMQHLSVIVLDLETTDEPQAIFETLNTGGAPLLPIDLVKNWLLWEASNSGLSESSCAALHSQYWKTFDADGGYWRQNVGTGHAARPRVDGFLVNWLTERTLKPIASGRVYEVFLDTIAEPSRLSRGGIADAAKIMSNMHEASEYYRKLDSPDSEHSRFNTFLHRLKAMKFVVLYPLLMHLLARAKYGSTDLDDCAVALESFLVRRIVCKLGTRGYGTLFINLLAKVAVLEPSNAAAPVITDFLTEGKSAATKWPDDKDFLHEWIFSNFYRDVGNRVPMILRALEEEEWRRDPLSIPLASYEWSKVQIEHVMPQAWQTHWPLEDGSDELSREMAIHRIGNLVLVSESLNPVLSNGPWANKRLDLAKHVHLRLTSGLTSCEIWNETAINLRTKELFQLARVIWPRPQME